MGGAGTVGVAGVRALEELVVWQLAVRLRDGVYEATPIGRFADDHALRRQMRTASASPARNIAEGFGRHSPLDFARFLTIARASLLELQTHLKHARTAGYLTQDEYDDLFKLSCRTMAGVSALRRYLTSPAAARNAKRHSPNPKNPTNPKNPKNLTNPTNLTNLTNPQS